MSTPVRTRFPNKVQMLFLAVYAAAVIVYYLQSPVPGWISVTFMPVIGIAVTGMILGVILYPGRREPAWLLLLAGVTLNMLGAGTALAYVKITGSVPYPSASDGLELSGYLFLVAGLVLLSRGGGFHATRRGVIISVVVTGLAAGLFSWPALIHPYTGSDDFSLFTKMVTIAYPSADVLMLFQVIVLAAVVYAMHHFRIGTGISASFWLIALGTVGVLVSDSLFAYALLHWSWSQPSIGNAGWFAWFGTWALAFLGPDRELSAKTWYLRARTRE